MSEEKIAARNYRDLIVWKLGIEFAKKVYSITQGFPREETYGLMNQMRRAAVSVPSNIAEGQARRLPTEFVRFLRIALGSLAELDTQLIIAHELGYISKQTTIESENDVTDLRTKLYALINSIKIH